MIDLVSKRFWFLAVSILVIIPGLIAIFTGGLKAGIDFTGGYRLTVAPSNPAANDAARFREVLSGNGYEEAVIKGGTIGEGAVVTQTVTLDIPRLSELQGNQREEELSELARVLITNNLVPGREEDVQRTVPITGTATVTPSETVTATATVALTGTTTITGTATATGTGGTTAEASPTALPAQTRTETVRRYVIDEAAIIDNNVIGPTVGRELLGRAIIAISLASAAILIYLTLVFRKVPNAFRYGVCAVVAILHDVLVVLGFFAILGHIFDTEIDALFITAMLTVIGFSVHDTIVVFDRVRENIMRRRFDSFEDVVNYSVVQTLARSINTSITIILTLFALYLFGGASIRNFVLALLLGIVAGTYSSIFNASMLLVVWEKGEWRGRRKESTPIAPATRAAR